MPHVAFVVQPRTLLTGLTMPAEMLRAADEIHRVQTRARSRLRLTVTAAGEVDTGYLGAIRLRRQARVEELDQVDLVYLLPFWRRPVPATVAVLATLARLEAAGTLVCAVSTGAYLAADAALLDGRVATTHWSFLDDFARRYPRVVLKRQHLVTRAGNLYCAGSLNATADLTAHFIERFYGAEIARRVEAQFSPEIRRPVLQHGFFDGETNVQPDELMAEAQQWLRDRSDRRVDLDELARYLEISRRSLNRRFREATGKTPLGFLQELRVAEASELLRKTNLSVAEVAASVGYEDAGHFATLYRRLTSRTPTSYRAAVRAKLFS